jgi:hypothetical protein
MLLVIVLLIPPLLVIDPALLMFAEVVVVLESSMVECKDCWKMELFIRRCCCYAIAAALG